MNKQIIKCNLNDILPLETAISHLKIDKMSDQLDDINALLNEAYRIGMPRAVFQECYVDSVEGDTVVIEGVVFTGSLIAEKLAGIHRVFPYVVSCGLELAQWAESLRDNLDKYYANTLNQYAAGMMNAYMTKYISKYSGIEKFATLNPGSLPDWPIREQIPLFELLGNVEEDIHVSLTSSCLMMPLKSVSGILFPSSVEWFNCMRCSRPDCPGRQSGFIEETNVNSTT